MRPGWSIRARRNRLLKIANGVDKTNISVPKRTTGSTTTNETRLENKNKGDLRLPFVVVHRSFPVAH